MKLTDLAILAMVFFICILVVVHTKSDMLYNQMFNRVMYNNVMDNITEEALNIGYDGVDANGRPKVSLDKLSRYFKQTTDMYGVSSRHIMCYVDYDGFYLGLSLSDYNWGDKIYFTEKNETAHEQKIAQLREKVIEEYGIDMMLPYNDGEKWENSVDDYSLLVISYDKIMKIYCFSGAKIHRK